MVLILFVLFQDLLEDALFVAGLHIHRDTLHEHGVLPERLRVEAERGEVWHEFLEEREVAGTQVDGTREEQLLR